MIDLINNTQMNITTMALDGLSQRNKLLAANIANADTPGYKRSDVEFQDQLGKILQNENAKEAKRVMAGLTVNQNSLLDNSEDSSSETDSTDSDNKNSFNPQSVTDDSPALRADGNNVNIEYEMAELSKNGMQYSALSQLQSKAYKNLQDIISKAG